MKVRPCTRCPYTPHDLADHYDPRADLLVCATCTLDSAPTGTPWRRTCVAIFGGTRTTQANVAPSATESSA